MHCENKAADQLCDNRTAYRHLSFRYVKRTFPGESPFLIRNFRSLAIFFGCTARFVLDLVGNPVDRFSHVAAHITLTRLFTILRFLLLLNDNFQIKHCDFFLIFAQNIDWG